MQIPDIKQRLPITKVLAHYNIKLDKNNHIKCPFHQDDKPSCKIYPETGTFHCFGCGATGDQIEFIEKYDKCSKHEAILKAKEMSGKLSVSEIPRAKRIGREETNAKDVMGIASKGAAKGKAEDFAGLFARQRASLPRSPKALDYLKSRGLNPEMEIGYNSGQYWNKLKQCITFPLKDQAGNITSLYGRRITESNGYNLEYGRHYYSENRKGLYPGYPSQDTQTLIITEAIIDAASLIQIAELKDTSILSAYGTNGLSTEHKRAITAWSNPLEINATNEKEIIFFFDGDQAGKEGAVKYAEELELRSDLVENDLSQLTDLLEEYRENQLQQSTKDADSDKTLTLAQQARCKVFLQQADLIQKLNQLIGQSGITGEDNNRLFLFVIATSHKMPETLHALIQGSSGSGKTHLLSKIAELMPDERVVKFTRVTENSFYNYDEYFFKGKLICLEDIDGLKEEALFAWRELISNNQLSSSTSQKDENGNIRSAQRIVRGPMASICATTHGQIYEDNMSRLFIIAVDESQEQTARIMNYQKQKAAGLIDAEKEREASALLQNLVRMLKPCKVINPYANQLHLPPQAHKIRRLNELYLAFVKQITIINQYQRKRDQQGRLITQKEDLKTAVTILFESIFLKVDELDGSLRQFFEALKTYLEEKPNAQQYEFTQREVRQALHISKTQLHRYLYELISLEYLQQTGGYANKGFKYRVSYWDNIQKLRNEIQDYLYNQIDNLAFQPLGTPDGTLQRPSVL